MTTGKILIAKSFAKNGQWRILGRDCTGDSSIFTDALKEKIKRAATTTDSDVIITEVGEQLETLSPFHSLKLFVNK